MLLEGVARLTKNPFPVGGVHPACISSLPALTGASGVVELVVLECRLGACIMVIILHAPWPGIVVLSDYLERIATGCQPSEAQEM